MPLLLVLGCIGLAVSFNQRVLDPLTALIATELNVDPHLVVMLSPAFTLPYALVQPFLGPVGDSFGKALVLKVCIIVLTLSTIAAAIAPDYATLLPMRLLAGLAGGGVIPASLALIADRYPLAERQVAMSHFMVALMVGQVFASPLSAAIAQAWNWHRVLLVAAVVCVASLLLLIKYIKPRPDIPRPPFSVARSLATYRALLKDPRARACYITVFFEGLCVLGFTPHIALFLKARGFGDVTEAGYVLAGVGLGGLAFTVAVKTMVRRFDPFRIMQTGGAVMGLCLITMPVVWSWQSMLVVFMINGFGFYMLHSGLQTRVTEVMPEARASAVSLHAFFLFLGIASGPILFQIASSAIGFGPTLIANGIGILVVSFLGIARLQRETGKTALR
ncbi:MAG: MFS transporter [Rhizobiales bacterium PAR1]|nr:MAG: MFS transporter [Rhizobiales bacterium PAR1]